MKKLVLAALVALTAGAASAGTLEIRNDGWFNVASYSNDFEGTTHDITKKGAGDWRPQYRDHEEMPHHNYPRNKGIHYNSNETYTVRFHPEVPGYGFTPITIKPNDHVLITYYGTVFTVGYNVDYNHNR